ncbi:hypothetical protein B0H14DRAFT_3581610 [Mycena olivaceomarginata]|nr:hypothetical protein B0H14DRAFT_3581610 [Mycena olivaceomarginata]
MAAIEKHDLIYLFSKNLETVQGQTLDPEGPTDGYRTLFGIVSGCLTTIFACTWVSVHPNVPPPDQRWFSLLGRRLRMMLVAVIAPELMVGFAARQFMAARWFSKEFHVSKTHGHFFCMGGFVSQNGHPVATLEQLHDPLFGEKYLQDIRSVKKDDILDKSDRDAFSKGVALVRVVWSGTQCLVRLYKRLPVTEIEVATLAFAVINVFIWVLWWGKPFNAQRPIVCRIINRRILRLGSQSDIIHLRSFTAVPLFWSIEDDQGYIGSLALFIKCLVGTVFGAINYVAWNANFHSPTEMWMWRSSTLLASAIPGVWGCLLVSWWVTDEDSIAERVLKAIARFTIVAGTPIFILCRLFLFIISFTALHALPPRAFIDVHWSDVFPHV